MTNNLCPQKLINHTSKSKSHNFTKYNKLPILQALVDVTIWFIGHTIKLSGLAHYDTSRTYQIVIWSCKSIAVIPRFHKNYWIKIDFIILIYIPKLFENGILFSKVGSQNHTVKIWPVKPWNLVQVIVWVLIRTHQFLLPYT
jgi:hypothetical protein